MWCENSHPHSNTRTHTRVCLTQILSHTHTPIRPHKNKNKVRHIQENIKKTATDTKTLNHSKRHVHRYKKEPSVFSHDEKDASIQASAHDQ